ncbi:MAG: Peptidase serine carboxypeptidase [Verrucomicrobiaceae bacterium]|nr:Peptidase serine carboxypeptidase [Verrucomicrobiaceae bacterium]
MTRHLIILAAVLALCPLLRAEEPTKSASAKEEAKKPEDKKPEEKKEEKKGDDKKPEVGRAEGAVTINGKKVEYLVSCSEMPILKPDGKPAAQVFYTAYTLKRAPDAATRPVTFCFNGGPGSSSVWVHLGAFGPKKVELPADGLHPPMPPGRLVENPNSLLDATDLVFIDPVNTGFSRAEDPQKVGDFLGVKEDISSIAEFIRMWVTREKRWRSPKFIAGESYGGIRGAGLAEHLASRHRIYLNGLIIVSGLLDYDVLVPDTLNDLPYQVLLPALTATAHYHKKLPPDLQADRAKAIAEARAFAYGDYAHALLLDSALPKAERDAVVKKLARLTGLAPKLIEEQKLRIDSGFFREMLLRDQQLVLGAYDGRVTGRDGSESEQQPEIEPFMNVVGGVAAVAMNAYLREELHYEKDLPYEVLNPQPSWNHGKGNSYTSVNGALSSAMKGNPHLHVLALVGMADLVTPADNMLHSLRHLQIPHELRANVHVAEYESGHMMYTNEPDIKKMHADITGFMRDCLK